MQASFSRSILQKAYNREKSNFVSCLPSLHSFVPPCSLFSASYCNRFYCLELRSLSSFLAHSPLRSQLRNVELFNADMSNNK